MSSVRIMPSALCGRLTVPLSKSAAHRAIICSMLAGQDDILPPDEKLSDDIIATHEAMEALLSSSSSPVTIDCHESGSTLRFLVPLAAALGKTAVFTGHGRLPERPIGVYLDCLPKHGARCETGGGLPLTVSGPMRPGIFFLPGDVSSQFVTGLLLALPLLSGDSRIVMTSPLQSAPYADMTCSVMESFGVKAEKEDDGWEVAGSQHYMPSNDFHIERDWSQAAFFIAAGMLGGKVELCGLSRSSCQGDRAAEMIFRSFGAKIRWRSGIMSVQSGRAPEHDFRIDASQIPDLVPVIAAAAAFLPGRRTVITNAGRLRLKESDRLAAMAGGLSSFGANVKEKTDGLEIEGMELLRGGKADGCGDHRVIMALATAALRCEKESVITDAESVRKSYPGFFHDYNRLGGKAYELGK